MKSEILYMPLLNACMDHSAYVALKWDYKQD